MPNYVEPFFGSGAIMLARPPDWPPRNETVNDIDCMIANFWRSVQADPEEVAYWADWPVNEADLHARHRWLHEQMVGGFIDKMHSDVAHFDPQIAGWWVWGISAWIGDGWCRPVLQGSPFLSRAGQGINSGAIQGGSGKGERRRPSLKPAPGLGVHAQRSQFSKPKEYPKGTLWQARPEVKGQGIHRTGKPVERQRPYKGERNGQWHGRPAIGKGGRGVHTMLAADRSVEPMSDQAVRVLASLGKLPDLGRLRKGVHRKQYGHTTTGLSQTIPFLNRPGAGVHKASVGRMSNQLPDIAGSRGASGRGIHTARASALLDYMLRLRDRLRYVRVCCGEWHRILGPSPTIHIGLTAVFLDPPYGSAHRGRVYAHDSLDIAADVQAWCVKHTDEPKLRIALCGYEGEHNNLEALGWSKVAWKASGGYGSRNKDNNNADRERIWFSPHCLDPAEQQGRLF